MLAVTSAIAFFLSIWSHNVLSQWFAIGFTGEPGDSFSRESVVHRRYDSISFCCFVSQIYHNKMRGRFKRMSQETIDAVLAPGMRLQNNTCTWEKRSNCSG